MNHCVYVYLVSQVVQMLKNPPDNAGDIRDTGSTVDWKDTLEGRAWQPLQYSCLENPMDREEPGRLQIMGSQESDTTEGLSPKIKAQLSGTSLKICFLAVT